MSPVDRSITGCFANGSFPRLSRAFRRNGARAVPSCARLPEKTMKSSSPKSSTNRSRSDSLGRGTSGATSAHRAVDTVGVAQGNAKYGGRPDARTRDASGRLRASVAESTDDNLWNEVLDRRPIRSLLPAELTGLTVLDAGAATGTMAHWYSSGGSR